MGKARKKLGRKIARTVDVLIPEIHEARRQEQLADKDLFEIVTDTYEPEKPLTKRQQRFRDHRDRLSKVRDEDVKDVKKPIKTIAKRERVKLLPKSAKRAMPVKPEKVLKGKPTVTKDLWSEDEPNNGSDYLENGKEFDLVVRKQRPARKPKTHTYIPSGRSAVVVAPAGASYNPEINDYQEYTDMIASEEVAKEKKESRITRQLALPEGVRYITHEEAQAELEQGFYEESSSEEEKDENEDDNEPVPEKKRPKAKTMKQRRRELRQKMFELERKTQKELTKRERMEFANLKKLLKEANESVTKAEENAKANAASKLLDRLLKKKKLGRGTFEDYEEPVLLPNELTGSLRLTKTEGGIIQERVKSMQSRNMLPVPGSKEKRRLPKRLKRKFVEKRAVKEVDAQSKVM